MFVHERVAAEILVRPASTSAQRVLGAVLTCLGRVARVPQITKKATGVPDLLFLERCFHKLMLNFTWWVNRKDTEGANLFDGGFLGLDNIGVLDRSSAHMFGINLQQADATAWMAMYCLNMLAIAIHLACVNKAYEDVCTKFLEHFLAIW